MEMKVRLVEPEQPKSAAEVENQLLEQHEESVNPTSEGESPEVVEEVSTDSPSQETREPLQEEELLSIISKRLDREINSFDDLQEARETSGKMDDEVSAFFKYKKETGRGVEDFVRLNKDYTAMDADNLIKEYLTATEEGLDEEDISAMMEDFKFDEELDDESDIRKVRLAKKKTVAKAKKYFNEAKEKYRVPLESSGSPSLEEDEGYSEYKQYVANAKTAQEEQLRRKNWFVDKTSEVFGSEFKGFEFNVNDKSYVFSPGDKAELKKLQETPMNWVNRFVDDEGLIKDAVGYHRSLAIAMNPEKFAKFFYEQGQSEAVDGVMRKTKNINMSERSAPQNASTSGGMQVRSVNPDSGRGLKIRSAARTS
tara:strand:- start:581 stop:1684 length:1104 start_codon:yes stop_codon:yes gene_type:complete